MPVVIHPIPFDFIRFISDDIVGAYTLAASAEKRSLLRRAQEAKADLSFLQVDEDERALEHEIYAELLALDPCGS